jgi:cobyrinic acid a,c-diamide synthase
MTTSLPRVMVTAARSGGGKTTVVCGLLRALQKRGLRPAAFKCGPDYIDPLFHSEVLGAKSGNLDLFFTPEPVARALLGEGAKGCDIAVLEGVMGHYDGLGGTTDRASSWHLASATGTPAVFVADARGGSLSLCAEINGFLSFRPDSRIKAVILNRCTKMQFAVLRPVIEENCKIKVLGFLPKDDEITLESRHLGLVTAQEVENLRGKIDKIAALLEENCDLDALLSLAGEAEPISYEPLTIAPVTKSAPVIAVARDRAFCFYYRENLELLETLGAKLAYFSPLTDNALPAGTSALYLGGGYPELLARELSENAAMRGEIKQAIEAGMPAFCECGGFLYLHESMTTIGGETYPMAGVLPGGCRWTGKLRRFGYVNLTANRDNLLCRAGASIPAHEFHYYESDDCGADFTAKKALRGTEWACIHANEHLFAGFPHLYFYANPAFAASFVAAAEQFQGETAWRS